MYQLGRNRYLFGDDDEEQLKNEAAFHRAYAVRDAIVNNEVLSTMRPMTQDICKALVGEEGPPLETLKVPDVLTWDAQTGLPHLHVSFILNHFIPRRHITRLYSLWMLHRFQTYLAEEFSDTPDIVPELAGSIPEGFAVPAHNPRVQFTETGLNAVPLDDMDVESSDSDMVIVAVTKIVSVERSPSTRWFMETDSCYPGYCRLVATTPELTDPSFLVDNTEKKCMYLNGNAILDAILQGSLLRLKMTGEELQEGELVRHGPAVTNLPRNRFRSKLVETDFVFAMPCTEWPDVPKKWLDRPTKSGWPSKVFKKKLIAEGCLVVCIPHRTSKWREVEWRISFSRAERALANSLTDIHRQCYVLLKVLVKGTLEPAQFISSYHLKTLLFWSCERFPQSMWQKDDASLGTCFLALLDELQHCLINRNLPHYFYPDNNLFSHIAPDFMVDVCKKVNWLRRNIAEAVFQFDVAEVFSFTPRALQLSALLGPLAHDEHYEETKQAYAAYCKVLLLLSKAVLLNGNCDDMIDYAREACQIQQVVFGKEVDFVSVVMETLETCSSPTRYMANSLETILRRFPSKRNIPWIKSNLACIYHAFFYSNELSDDRERVLARAGGLFREAVASPGATAASWTDYANFLFKEAASPLEVTEAVEQVINLSKSGPIVLNSYDESDIPSLPDEIGEDIRQDGTLVVPSVMYAIYLSVVARLCDGCHDEEKVAQSIRQMTEFLSGLTEPSEVFSSSKLLGYCLMATADYSGAKEAFQKAQESIQNKKQSSVVGERILLCDAMKLSLS
ncbi:hypothetical protein CAPTEDRAFT_224084 [Capitella teleta]|uniref:Uncharacterized protein n=1 Tax=Capitella teleta TaxID=283909 RepID=R7U0R1_CAPTE|nr:hypothetical protein CAPTEDRAFT_224084 [Capitella teleta]|eukprot:ELT99594.1 hypothetical protein CAPTEDRAFT_224084 [Capitella teleta]